MSFNGLALVLLFAAGFIGWLAYSGNYFAFFASLSTPPNTTSVIGQWFVQPSIRSSPVGSAVQGGGGVGGAFNGSGSGTQTF